MRSSLFLVMALVGCSDDPTNVDGPCSLTDPCGDSAVCDFTAEAGPMCIPKAGDVDGDGLTNDKDFCNHQMGGQFDEDGDGVGDDCDRCPIAPPRPTPDSDNDMVDAPCDPAPTTDGDTILLFDGFQNGLNPDWTPTSPGVWTAQGGELIGNLAGLSTQQFLKTNVIGKNSIAIEASYRIDKVETGGTQHVVAVIASDPRPAGVSSMACGVTKADATTTELVLVETNQGSMSQMVSDAFNTANLYRAGGYATGTRAACSVLSNGNPLGVVQAAITPDQLSSVAVTALATSVRFQYVIVIGH